MQPDVLMQTPSRSILQVQAAPNGEYQTSSPEPRATWATRAFVTLTPTESAATHGTATDGSGHWHMMRFHGTRRGTSTDTVGPCEEGLEEPGQWRRLGGH